MSPLYPGAADPVGALTRAGGATEAHSVDHGRVIGIWENVKRHGAAGDGTTDDTTAIAAAITAASGGGTVYFPPGVYRASAINVSGARVVLQGAGPHMNTGSAQAAASVLKYLGAGTTDFLTVSGGNCVVRNLGVDGNLLATNIVKVTGADSILDTISVSQFAAAGGFGIYMAGDRFWLTNLRVSANAAATSTGIGLAALDGIMDGVRITGTTTWTLDAQSNGTIVNGCHFTSASAATGNVRVGGQHSVWTGNYFDTCQAGPVVTFQKTTAALVDVVFVGNTVYDVNIGSTQAAAISLIGTSFAVRNCVLAENTIVGTQAFPWTQAIVGSGTVDTMTIVNNNIFAASAIYNARPQISGGNVRTLTRGGSAYTDDPIRRVRLTADRISTSVSLADVTGLTLGVEAGQSYSFHFDVMFQTDTVTTGIALSINGPANNHIVYNVTTPITQTAEVVANQRAVNTGAASTGIDTINANTLATIDGLINPTADGTVVVRFATEVGASQVTVKAGSGGYVVLL